MACSSLKKLPNALEVIVWGPWTQNEYKTDFFLPESILFLKEQPYLALEARGFTWFCGQPR